MKDLPRQKLCELITKYGHALCDNPQRFEGLLRDFCGQYRAEIFVLVTALKEGVAAELLKSSRNSVHQELLLARLSKRLQDLGMSEKSAQWAVNSWALALGVSCQLEESGGNNGKSPQEPDLLTLQKNLSGILGVLEALTERIESLEEKHNQLMSQQVNREINWQQNLSSWQSDLGLIKRRILLMMGIMGIAGGLICWTMLLLFPPNQLNLLERINGRANNIEIRLNRIEKQLNK